MQVSFKISIYTIFSFTLLSSNIYSNNKIILEKTFFVGENQIIKPFSNSQILTYTQTSVFLNNQKVYSIDAGKITHIEIVREKSKAFVFSIHNQGNKEPGKFTCQPISEAGTEGPPWQIDIPYDFSLPKITVYNNKLFFFWSETQTYSVYELNGMKINTFNLFGENDWDHEKKLLSIVQNNDLYLLGMPSANLAKTENVHLFKIGSTFKPIHYGKIELTIPYNITISSNNMLAIAGTRSKNGQFEQQPYLYIYSLDKSETISGSILDVLPKRIFHSQNDIFLTFKDRINKYDPFNLSRIITTLLEKPVFFLGIEQIEKSIIMVTAEKIDAGQTGPRFSGISIISFDNISNNFSNYSVSPDQNYSKINISYLGNSSQFYIQLDRNIYQYRLED
jgi:hypothetical protein